MGVGVCHPGADDALVDQVEPVAGIGAQELAEDAAPAVGTYPHLQRLEAGVKAVGQVGVQASQGRVHG